MAWQTGRPLRVTGRTGPGTYTKNIGLYQDFGMPDKVKDFKKLADGLKT